MERRCCGSQGRGGDLVAAAAALSVLIARGKTEEQISLLAALFTIVGDSLGLLALKAPSEENCCGQNEPQTGNEDKAAFPPL